ncbi:helix-turn-helix domain-containing protein [Secundilactobacillus mixtipabuli]|uniref:XRE family transcriptional regulator n=1 Tax=Secundilactobacillus mixtipabuli TaxID=1435342 RepID=A0A1Z5I9P2_9LACO|nr:helix-turn-helix domain-containing protein [Secundilactobacillus mixtipabuli]GAW98526.1 XRE family transcriptional regulator [Secundilactobacillus mixtipabuli]
MPKNVKFDDDLKERLKDPEFKKAFDRISARLEAGVAIFDARKKAGLTRSELAHKVHMPVEAIRRIEDGGSTSDRIRTKIKKTLNIKSTERTDPDDVKPSK